MNVFREDTLEQNISSEHAVEKYGKGKIKDDESYTFPNDAWIKKPEWVENK